jgi:hypothetical protein
MLAAEAAILLAAIRVLAAQIEVSVGKIEV